jgi:hypothetical protein
VPVKKLPGTIYTSVITWPAACQELTHVAPANARSTPSRPSGNEQQSCCLPRSPISREHCFPKVNKKNPAVEEGIAAHLTRDGIVARDTVRDAVGLLTNEGLVTPKRASHPLESQA